MAEGDPDLERISGSAPLPASLEPARPRTPLAWQPITPRGVAAFAHAKWSRLLVISALMALLAAGAITWFIGSAWAPVVAAAIENLPDTGQIEHAQLVSPRASPEPLATNPFLGIGVDIQARSNANAGTDTYVKFQRTEVLLCSFLGCATVYYPRGWSIQFNRPQLVPWWGAWKTMLLTLIFVGAALVLFLVWLALGLLYTPVAWLTALIRKRKLTGHQAWRLATASNLPGASLFTLALLLYFLGPLGLAPFCFLALAHVVPAWIYVILCPAYVPDAPKQPITTAATFPPPKSNPFAVDRTPPPV